MNPDTFTQYMQYFAILTDSGLYPILQAICMILLKKNQDPLQLITKLDVMTLVSRTQYTNDQFLDGAKDNDDYDQLDEE